MSDDLDDIQEEPLEEEQPFDGEATPTGKFTRPLGSDSRKFKLSGMFKDWFLDYSSYVILQRAVPHIVDGLKPVQRRVLHAMYKMDDGNFTKVANIVGQAMQYHPHGDASILGALVQLGQKGIIIGKGGAALKKVGTQARLEMEDFFQKKVFLSTYVKVDPDWRENRKELRRFGYEF